MTDVITVSLKLLKLVIILMDLEETKHRQSLGNASTVALLSILINWSLHEVSTMFSIVVGFSIDRHHTVDCPHLHCYSTVCVCVCVSANLYISCLHFSAGKPVLQHLIIKSISIPDMEPCLYQIILSLAPWSRWASSPLSSSGVLFLQVLTYFSLHLWFSLCAHHLLIISSSASCCGIYTCLAVHSA